MCGAQLDVRGLRLTILTWFEEIVQQGARRYRHGLIWASITSLERLLGASSGWYFSKRVRRVGKGMHPFR